MGEVKVARQIHGQGTGSRKLGVELYRLLCGWVDCGAAALGLVGLHSKKVGTRLNTATWLNPVWECTLKMDYVEFLIDEWRIPEHPRRLRACLRRVLTELEAEALLILRREPELQVMVCLDLTSEVDYLGVFSDA